METILQLYTLIVLCSIIFIDLFHEQRSGLSAKLVMAIVIFALVPGALLEGFPSFPHLPDMLNMVSRAIFLPASYLYLRHRLTGVRLKKRDFLHLGIFASWCFVGTIMYFKYPSIHPILKGSLNLRGGLPLDLFLLVLFSYAAMVIYFWLVLSLIQRRGVDMYQSKKLAEAQLMATGQVSLKNNQGSYRTLSLSQEKVATINQKVRDFMEREKPFLQQGYSLRDLSDETRIPLHQLSAFINTHCRMHYSHFINEFRIDYCKEKIMNLECRSKKLEAIARESGFQNRNTFTAAFKKITGEKPSQFLKDVNSGKYSQLPASA
jgi:AraC-like DNA-binding protein